MKKWIWLIPAGAAAAAGAMLLLRKGHASQAPASPARKGEAPVKQSYHMAQPGSGCYSFVSGYRDAKTVELHFAYDTAAFECKEIAEDFPAPTSVSHAEVIRGEDFLIQLEYTDFAAGEDFASFTGLLREKQKGFAPVKYGSNEGFRYYNGDNVCFVFPATDFSCVLATAIVAKGSDLDYRELHQEPQLAAFMESLAIS